MSLAVFTPQPNAPNTIQSRRECAYAYVVCVGVCKRDPYVPFDWSAFSPSHRESCRDGVRQLASICNVLHRRLSFGDKTKTNKRLMSFSIALRSADGSWNSLVRWNCTSLSLLFFRVGDSFVWKKPGDTQLETVWIGWSLRTDTYRKLIYRDSWFIRFPSRKYSSTGRYAPLIFTMDSG